MRCLCVVGLRRLTNLGFVVVIWRESGLLHRRCIDLRDGPHWGFLGVEEGRIWLRSLICY